MDNTISKTKPNCLVNSELVFHGLHHTILRTWHPPSHLPYVHALNQPCHVFSSVHMLLDMSACYGTSQQLTHPTSTVSVTDACASPETGNKLLGSDTVQSPTPLAGSKVDMSQFCSAVPLGDAPAGAPEL